MIRYPYTLFLRLDPPKEYDELGRPIPPNSNDQWEKIGECRCYDDATVELVSNNGEVFRSKYHIVYKGRNITEGVYVKCVDKSSGVTRREGMVYRFRYNNFFNIYDIWL